MCSKLLVRSSSILLPGGFAQTWPKCLRLRDPIQLEGKSHVANWEDPRHLKLITAIINTELIVRHDIFNNKLMTFIELIACSITREVAKRL